VGCLLRSNSFPAQHCLWAVDALTWSQHGALQLQVLQAWSLRGKLCAATGDSAAVYLVLCGTHFLSYCASAAAALLIPFAGSVQAGY
jgi:hypothetical protein